MKNYLKREFQLLYLKKIEIYNILIILSKQNLQKMMKI